MSVLVVAEHECGRLSASTYPMVTAAVDLAFVTASEVHVLVVGERSEEAAESAAEISGVMSVICVSRTAEDGAVLAIVQALASKYRHIVFASSSKGARFAENLASILNVRHVFNVTKVVSADAFEIIEKEGRVVVRCRDRVVVVTVDITKFPNAGSFGHASIEVMTVAQLVRPEWPGLGLGVGTDTALYSPRTAAIRLAV